MLRRMLPKLQSLRLRPPSSYATGCNRHGVMVVAPELFVATSSTHNTHTHATNLTTLRPVLKLWIRTTRTHAGPQTVVNRCRQVRE